jgi:molybdenum cofactor cytidylyltransferase
VTDSRALDTLRSAPAALRATHTTALLLAAGRGTRFGGRKLLAELDGTPIVRAAAERVLAARPAELVVVVAPDDGAVRAALDGLPLRFADAPPGEGLAASLRAGVDAAHPATRRILVALGDQPRVDPAVVARILAAPDAPIVVPSYRGTRGHPVRFDVALAAELRAVEGDRGARDVVARERGRVVELFVDAEAPDDVDTPGALARLRAGEAAAAR